VNHIQVWKEPLPAKPISLKPYAAQESAENLKAHSHTINQGREAERMERQMSKSSAANRLTKPGASLPLFLLLLTADLGAVAFKTPAPGMRGGVHMPPAAMATAIQNHLGSLNPGVLGRLDAGALLAAVKSNILAAQSQPAPDSGIRIVSGLAIMRALAAPEEFSSLNAYLTSAKSAEQAALGRQAIADLTPWFSKIRQSPATQGKIMVETKGLQSQLAQAGFLDAAHSQALFDGTLAEEQSAGALAAPAVFTGGAAEEKPGSRPGSQLSRPERAATKRKQTPATPPVKPAPGLDFGDEKTRIPSAPVKSQPQKDGQDAQVAGYVDALLRLDPDDANQRQQGRGAARTWGAKDQEAAAAQSAVLQNPLKRRENEDAIDSALKALQVQVETLDPEKVNFTPGPLRLWLDRTLLYLKVPYFKLPAQRYADNYDQAQQAITDIVTALKSGRDALLADNAELLKYQSRLRALTRQLQTKIDFARRVDQELDARLNAAAGDISEDRARFLKEEVLFPFRQRLIDLQTQLAVNQQGVIATGIVIKNNELLAGSVDRTVNVIPPALQVAINIALSLKQQQSVLDRVTATNHAGSQMIEQSAEGIKNQALAIDRQAVDATLPVDTLKSAFGKLKDTLNEISSFRDNALPQMLEEIKKFDELTRIGEDLARSMDSAGAANPKPSWPEAEGE